MRVLVSRSTSCAVAALGYRPKSACLVCLSRHADTVYADTVRQLFCSTPGLQQQLSMSHERRGKRKASALNQALNSALRAASAAQNADRTQRGSYSVCVCEAAVCMHESHSSTTAVSAFTVMLRPDLCVQESDSITSAMQKRLDHTERRLNQIISFFSHMAQNPTVLAHMVTTAQQQSQYIQVRPDQ